MKKVIRVVATSLSLLSAAAGALHYFRAKTPAGLMMVAPKMVAAAYAPFLALAGFVGAVLSLIAGLPLALVAGLAGAWASARYTWRVLTASSDFDTAFGPGWNERIPAEQSARMLQRRWTWRPSSSPEMHIERDVAYYTIPGSDRRLLCDVWRPVPGVPSSGLAFIYFHGSGWHFLDKDMGTRPLFRHLAAQGHVVMDVAYRLCPETGWQGMVEDVKHAIAWMKANAACYGADPERVVLGGGSAGGHLALMAAYTTGRRDLTPEALVGSDLTVCGVVSWYGPTDMAVYYEHAGKVFSSLVAAKSAAGAMNERMMNAIGLKMDTPAHWQPGTTVQDSMMRALLGGTPDETPEAYRQASPITYAGPQCPPTLLMQGEHDAVVSAEAVRAIAEKLRVAGVKVVHVEYPQTEHAFDLVPWGVPTQASWYETERFLALLALKPVIAPVAPGVNGATVGQMAEFRQMAQPVIAEVI